MVGPMGLGYYLGTISGPTFVENLIYDTVNADVPELVV